MNRLTLIDPSLQAGSDALRKCQACCLTQSFVAIACRSFRIETIEAIECPRAVSSLLERQRSMNPTLIRSLAGARLGAT
jgi:hypothetical protein